MTAPHTPEFSTTRSFPGVRGVEASPEAASARASWPRGTPPMIPRARGPRTLGILPPLMKAGRANIATSIERRSKVPSSLGFFIPFVFAGPPAAARQAYHIR
jgi:hypothetical protein